MRIYIVRLEACGGAIFRDGPVEIARGLQGDAEIVVGVDVVGIAA